MKILFDLGNGGRDKSWLRKSRVLGLAIRPLLKAAVLIDQLYLQLHPEVPLLYHSGVVYREEDLTKGYEDFAIVPAILRRGHGDCDDLGPWRCAELRNSGENADIRVEWKKTRKGKLYHIVVRRGNGTIEDPSKILGM